MSTGPETDPNVERIRPEGVAVNYGSLNLSQQEAFRRLVYTMQEAVENIGLFYESPRRFRPNNIVFVSGARGTGKTCLLHSFMRYTSQRHGHQTQVELNRFFDESSRRRQALQTVRESIVWLPTIDIDPLPKDFDLVSSVLVRIRHVIDELNQSQRSHTYHPPTGDAAAQIDLEEHYQSLLCDAAQAWAGGLMGAGSSQEPEFFAIVARTLAEANMTFTDRFRRYLDAVANQVFSENTIFVLPIDDTDLKPATGLSILKLLRMLHAPRLFVIAMGDISLFELVSSLEMTREMGLEDHLNAQALLPVNADTVRRHVSAITATAIRKLVPPDQRIELAPWPTEKGLEFRPHGAKRSLASLLSRIPVIFHSHVRPEVRENETCNDFKQYDHRVQAIEKRLCMKPSLLTFLRPVPDARWEAEHRDPLIPFAQHLVDLSIPSSCRPESPATEGQVQYFGARVLESSARRITDLWFSMRRLEACTDRCFRRHVENGELSDFDRRTLNGTDDTGEMLRKIRCRVLEAPANAPSEENATTGVPLEYDYRLLWRNLLQTFQKLCRQSLMEEEVLDVSAREAIDRSFEEHADHVDWSQLPLSLRPTWSAGRSAGLVDRRLPWDREAGAENSEKETGQPRAALELTTGATVRFHFARPELWTVETASAAEVRADVRKAQVKRRNQFGTFKHRPLSSDTAAMVALYHDLLKLSPEGEHFHTGFADMSVYEGLPWAHTEYEIGPKNKCTLYWPAPPCLTVYGLDHFASLWRYMTTEEQGSVIRPERFLLGWITFGCGMVNSNCVPDSTLKDLLAGEDTDAIVPSGSYGGIVGEVTNKALEFGLSTVEWISSFASDSDLLKAIDREWKQKLSIVDRRERKLQEAESRAPETLTDACFRSTRCLLTERFYVYMSDRSALGTTADPADIATQIRRASAVLDPKTGSGAGDSHLRSSDFLARMFQSREEDSLVRDSSQKRPLPDILRTLYEDISLFRLCRQARTHLVRCADKALRLLGDSPDSDTGRNYREWLLNVISLTMPEFGFDGNLRRHLLFASAKDGSDGGPCDRLIEFIEKHRRAIRGRRARRLAKLVWLGVPHTAVRLAYADPNLWGRLTRLTQRGFFRAFHFVHEQHGDIQHGLLWFNDDQRVAGMATDNLLDRIMGGPDTQTSSHKSRDHSGIDPTLSEEQRIRFARELGGGRELIYFLRQTKEGYESPRDVVQQQFMMVVRKAAESMSAWDSSSHRCRSYRKRLMCVKRLWWLERPEQENVNSHRSDSSAEESAEHQNAPAHATTPPPSDTGEANGTTSDSPYLSPDEHNEVVAHLSRWQFGRGLTPSIEEIDIAGKTIYGVENWDQVSLRRFSYDLDFAEESHFRRS